MCCNNIRLHPGHIPLLWWVSQTVSQSMGIVGIFREK